MLEVVNTLTEPDFGGIGHCFVQGGRVTWSSRKIVGGVQPYCVLLLEAILRVISLRVS